jgi:hypothetical protein
MTMILGGRDLLTIVNGTEKKPAGAAADDAVIAWMKRDMAASAILVQTIDQEILKTLVGCTTSAEIWSHLSTLQERKASQSVDKLQKQFFDLKFQQKIGCYDFISSITLLVSQLKNLGETTFNDRVVMTRILGSLPKVYNPLITAWNLLPKEQQTLELLKLKLLEEEERLTDQTSMEEETKAFAAWTQNRTRAPSAGTSGRHLPGHNNVINRGPHPSGNNTTYIPGSSGSQQLPARSYGSGYNSHPHQQNTTTQDTRIPLTYEHRRERQNYYDNLKQTTLCYECGEPGHWGKECAK